MIYWVWAQGLTALGDDRRLQARTGARRRGARARCSPARQCSPLGASGSGAAAQAEPDRRPAAARRTTAFTRRRGARAADRRDRRRPRRPRSRRDQRSGEVAEKDLTLALARELRDELVEARPGPRRDDPRRRPLSDPRRSRGGRPAARCRDVRLAPHGQRAQSARARRERLFAVRRRFGRRGGALRRAPRMPAPSGDGRDGVGRGDALRPRDALADERVGRPCVAAGRQGGRAVRASAEAAPLRRFPRASPRRRRRPCCSRPATSAMPTTSCCCAIPSSRATIVACACPGDRGRRRGARAPLTGFPRAGRTG